MLDCGWQVAQAIQSTVDGGESTVEGVGDAVVGGAQAVGTAIGDGYELLYELEAASAEGSAPLAKAIVKVYIESECELRLAVIAGVVIWTAAPVAASGVGAAAVAEIAGLEFAVQAMGQAEELTLSCGPVLVELVS
ncbi:MAG: hypothetical protein AB7L91_08090 [Dehalococcoidia bacterium]